MLVDVLTLVGFVLYTGLIIRFIDKIILVIVISILSSRSNYSHHHDRSITVTTSSGVI